MLADLAFLSIIFSNLTHSYKVTAKLPEASTGQQKLVLALAASSQHILDRSIHSTISIQSKTVCIIVSPSCEI